MTDEITPQVQGRLWEDEFAASIGAQTVPQSGAGFRKLDVKGLDVLFSLKWSANNKSFRVSDDLMDEAIAAIHGPGGIGGDVTPAVAFKTAGYEWIAMRKEDAMRFMMSEEVSIAAPVKRKGRKERDPNAGKPSFLRGQ